MRYVKLRVEFSRLEFVKRCAHHKTSLRSSSGDTKALYKKVNRLLGNDTQNLPKYKDPVKLSEDFFAENVATIRQAIKKTKTKTKTLFLIKSEF